MNTAVFLGLGACGKFFRVAAADARNSSLAGGSSDVDGDHIIGSPEGGHGQIFVDPVHDGIP